jgi:hypothetical protein
MAWWIAVLFLVPTLLSLIVVLAVAAGQPGQMPPGAS